MKGKAPYRQVLTTALPWMVRAARCLNPSATPFAAGCDEQTGRGYSASVGGITDYTGEMAVSDEILKRAADTIVVSVTPRASCWQT